MIFFIKSKTIDLERYTIKDIPGSSGRLDVISRNILAALLNKDRFSPNTKIWVFLDRYGTYIFDTDLLNYEKFPKSELLFTDHFVKLIRESNEQDIIAKREGKALEGVSYSDEGIIAALERFSNQGYKIYILKETGKRLSEILKKQRIPQLSVFLVGSQQGEFIESAELAVHNFNEISLGEKSYLGSHTIRLIKILLNKCKNFF